ncbi:MAG: iron-sulfur cluster assembly scaffold protein [Desulfamplus sp.]|nr:iron-sulfur cluster assembly scaffold protein [Desulfamplus sp.]MBF0389430.1 iron-sulfur cluster assembly scaffold protein [Desulfamplus sp.]
MDFLQDHSLEYLEMALSYDKMERIENPDGYGTRTGECGDTVEFFIMKKDGFIDHISYYIDGCKNTNACANTVVKMAQNKKIDEMWDKITPEVIASYLKTLPADEIHCAELAAGAFYLALKSLDK